MRGIPRGISARLCAGFLLAALPALLAAGWLLERGARRALEIELGRRAETLALAIGTSIPAETWEMLFALGAGEEESRIARHMRGRLREVESATGAERISIWRLDGALVLDSRSSLPIGSAAPRAELLAAELRQVASGVSASTPLFRSERGRWVKLGLAPLRAPGGRSGGLGESPPGAASASASGASGASGAAGAAGAGGAEASQGPALGVLVAEAPATSLDAVAEMRRGLALVGGAGALLIVAASLLLAGALTRRLDRLAGAARRMEEGDLEAPLAGYGRDEIGALAGALEAMRGAVRLREQHLRAMLGGVSHEIRNPLGGLLLNAELLARDAALAGLARERARRILEEATHLEGIVSEFLAYARPERPVPEEVSLADLVEESARRASESLRWPGRMEVETEALRVRCDAGHARQIVLNLLLNAMQAAGPEGRVRVGARGGDRGVELSVEDDGPGIPPEERERVFEPFYSTRAQGAGLGLAIVRRLCDLGGIALGLDASPLGGARFTLRWDRPRGR